MKYSVRQSDKITEKWAQAAAEGGTIPDNPAAGESRSYRVDAWTEVDGVGPVRISGIRASEMEDETRKAALRELDLPVTKALVYKDRDGNSSNVADFEILDVYDGWCTLDVTLVDGSSIKVHNMYFSEMNGDSLPYPPEFIVFDIETTGRSRTAEIAEIAAIKVVNGQVDASSEFSTTVYIDGQMPDAARDVNHITDEELENSPHMTSALTAFVEFIGPRPILVGHNIKTFDVPHIKRVAKACNIDFSYQKLIDTLELAKRAWPDEGHTMDELREALGIDNHNAHRALKDCYDELAVYIAALTELKEHPEKRKGAERGEDDASTGSPAKSQRGAAFTQKWVRRKAKDVTTNRTEFDTDHPVYGKGFVFSGESFAGHSYDECMQIVKDLGGVPQDNVKRATNYLVVGEGGGSGKTSKAIELREKGYDVKIITDDDFSQLVGWSASDTVEAEVLGDDNQEKDVESEDAPDMGNEQEQQQGDANGWILVSEPSKRDSGEVGDCVLYIEHTERKVKRDGTVNQPKRPSDGSVRETVASGWFEDDGGFPEFAGQPWYGLRERIGRVVVLDHWRPLSCRYLFDGLTNCKELELLNLDTSMCTDFHGMFRGCTSVRQLLDLDRLDTSKVMDYSYMFLNCLSLRAVSIAGWKVIDGASTDHMLSGCSAYVIASDEQDGLLDAIAPAALGKGIWHKTTW